MTVGVVNKNSRELQTSGSILAKPKTQVPSVGAVKMPVVSLKLFVLSIRFSSKVMVPVGIVHI